MKPEAENKFQHRSSMAALRFHVAEQCRTPEQRNLVRQTCRGKERGVDGRPGGKRRGNRDDYETNCSERSTSRYGQRDLFLTHYLIRAYQHGRSKGNDDLDYGHNEDCR